MTLLICYRCNCAITPPKFITIKLPTGDKVVCMACYLVNFK